jgi:hypothetical protein
MKKSALDARVPEDELVAACGAHVAAHIWVTNWRVADTWYRTWHEERHDE